MVGEYKLAKELLADAMDEASKRNDMCTDAMANAVLTSTLDHMVKTTSREELQRLFQYSLDSLEEDEFLVTRGC